MMMDAYRKAMHPKSFMLRAGYALEANFKSWTTALFFLVLHILLGITVLEITLINGNYAVSWSMLFLPLLVSNIAALGFFLVQLVKRSYQEDERTVFLRSFLVFTLLICLASATLAALVAKGIQITNVRTTLANVPVINARLGTFHQLWTQPNSLLETPPNPANGDTTAYIKAFSPTLRRASFERPVSIQEEIEQWVGLNISSAEIHPVFDQNLFMGKCMAYSDSMSKANLTSPATLRECPLSQNNTSKEKSRIPTNKFCSMTNLFDGPISQTCDARSTYDSHCLLIVPPQTVLENRSTAASNIEIGLAIERSTAKRGVSCSNGCEYSGDQACDDGWYGADYQVCAFGSDCSDCGERYWHDRGMRTNVFPTCGYFGPNKKLPQRHFAPWAKGVRTSCVSKCPMATVSSFCSRQEGWNQSGSHVSKCSNNFGSSIYSYWDRNSKTGEEELSWCCDELSSEPRMMSQAIFLNGGDTLKSAEDCVRSCLIEHYLDQDACNLIQFNKRTGSCERILYRDHLCSREDDGLNCGQFLEASTLWPIEPPQPAESSFAFAKTNPWNRVEVAPKEKSNVWDRESSADWTIYVLLSQAFTNSLPTEYVANGDMQVVLAPFICFPLLLGLLVVCVCCTPLNCLPDLRITHEDICAWDYIIFSSPPFQNAQLHNFRILVCTFALSLAQIMLLLQKAVFVEEEETALYWTTCLIPTWITGFLVLASTINAMVRVRIAWINSCSFDSHNASRRGARFNLSNDRGQLVLKASLVLSTFLLPMFISLALMAVRADLERSTGVAPFNNILVPTPVLVGLGLDILAFLFYTYTAIRARLHIWKISKLEKIELATRAELRSQRVAQVSQLKASFLSSTATGEELIQILRLLVYHGREMAISQEEIRALGQAKIATLNVAGQLKVVWTKDVAQEYGEVLRYLLTHRSADQRMSQVPSSSTMQHIQMEDLGYGSIRSYFTLFFYPSTIHAKMAKFVARQAEKEKSKKTETDDFNSFLSEKSRLGKDPSVVVPLPPVSAREPVTAEPKTSFELSIV